MDKVLNFLGLCKRAGSLVTGEDGALGAARSGEARLVMLASDAAENTSKKAGFYAETCGVILVRLPYDKDVLGDMLGRRVCAIMAITDKNFAKSFLEKLSSDYPGYKPALEELTEKLKSRKERREKLH
ncbi:MAG: ribosomal L7Ae/L30e/S12e/Gadd45 family protein [Clostridiales bacterium]|nr:ribosomal L7Ae/L30e/S12e/Gadd45 family protein [Clostridiales bacterium]